MKKIINGFFMAWGCFSTIPCPTRNWDEESRNHMLAMVPFVGGLIGVVNLVLCYILNWFFVDFRVIALSLAVMPFVMSGFMHLDGFMDVNDAVMSRRPLAERQRILKDSRVGAFAVITTIMLFLTAYVCVLVICEVKSTGALLVYGMIPYATRCVGILNVMIRKPMETSQYAKSYEDESKVKLAKASMIFHGVFMLLIIAVAYYFHWVGYEVLAVPIVMLVQELLISSRIKQLGGMNGDIAGYSIVMGEVICAVILAII